MVNLKFVLISTFGMTFNLTSIYHHRKFENDILKTQDARLLGNRQTDYILSPFGWRLESILFVELLQQKLSATQFKTKSFASL